MVPVSCVEVKPFTSNDHPTFSKIIEVNKINVHVSLDKINLKLEVNLKTKVLY